MSGADAETVRAALHALTDLSLGQAVDDAYVHESSLNAYAALDALAGRVAEAEKALRRIACWPFDVNSDAATDLMHIKNYAHEISLAQTAAGGGAVQTGEAEA